MFAKRRNSFTLACAILLFYLLSFIGNDWLSATMARHQLLQLPGMLAVGFWIGYRNMICVDEVSWGISALIFIAASLIFWMLPRSVDLTILHPSVNRIMHLNMVFCGILWVGAFRGLILEIKILFLGMMAAMWVVSGIALRTFNLLLCNSFDIPQQMETGFYLILAGLFLFLATFIVLFKTTGRGDSQVSY